VDKKTVAILATSSLFILFVVVGVGLYVFNNLEDGFKLPGGKDPVTINRTSEIQKFKSEEEFRTFLESNYEDDYGYGGRGGGLEDFLDAPLASDSFSPGFDGLGSAERSFESNTTPNRHSVTNTQVLTIDESDIVKTDGNYIFYSRNEGYYGECYYDEPYYGEPMPDSTGVDIYYPRPQDCDNKTSIVEAFPVENLSVITDINEAGELYLVDDTLIVEKADSYSAYDVSNKEEPEEVWSFDYEGYLVTSREYNGDLYIITQNYVYEDTPCPIPLLEREGGVSTDVLCTDIYYPASYGSHEELYTVTKIDPESGDVKDTLSFLSSSYGTIVYMSENNIYITYPDNPDEFSIFYDFIVQNDDLFSESYVAKVEKLNSYDISASSKMNELYELTDDYFNSMPEDEAMKREKDILNAFDRYRDKNIRVFSGTGIVVIDNQSLAIKKKGKVQGYLNDQFSLDEYNGMLRVTTTVNPYSSGYYLFDRYYGFEDEMIGMVFPEPSSQTENDLVIFDEDLNVIGEVRGLGLTEEVYSTRFVNDVAYVVTFRQIDPFYVIDLSNPREPIVKGELKIPGYSSYLHPLSKNLILGIGQEDFRVKISLFDVTNPSRPVELSKYSIGEHWTEVEGNHNAFLHDPEHKVFFLPAEDGGYVLSYENDELTLTKTVSGYDVERAIYIDDYMYILSRDEIVVFDENSWEKIDELKML
jgi:inhibitor of cysteine peptidase